jgi:hypothetical protein
MGDQKEQKPGDDKSLFGAFCTWGEESWRSWTAVWGEISRGNKQELTLRDSCTSISHYEKTAQLEDKSHRKEHLLDAQKKLINTLSRREAV